MCILCYVAISLFICQIYIYTAMLQVAHFHILGKILYSGCECYFSFANVLFFLNFCIPNINIVAVFLLLCIVCQCIFAVTYTCLFLSFLFLRISFLLITLKAVRKQLCCLGNLLVTTALVFVPSYSLCLGFHKVAGLPCGWVHREWTEPDQSLKISGKCEFCDPFWVTRKPFVRSHTIVILETLPLISLAV